MSRSNRWARHVAPNSKMVMVLGWAIGPLGLQKDLYFVMDTGTPVTILASKLARELDMGEDRSVGGSRLMGPTGPQDGSRVIVPRLKVMGRTLTDFEVHCHDLEPQLHVEGVLGLDVLGRGALLLNLPQGLVEFRWSAS